MRYILHADDDHTDRWDFKYLVNTEDPSVNVLGFTNGLELMQYLGGISDQLLPSFIFLDLRMPIWDGPKTLQAIKHEPRFMAIPVYIWSIADTSREMQLCLKLGAEKFLTKPTTQEEHANSRKFISSLLNV